MGTTTNDLRPSHEAFAWELARTGKPTASFRAAFPGTGISMQNLPKQARALGRDPRILARFLECSHLFATDHEQASELAARALAVAAEFGKLPRHEQRAWRAVKQSTPSGAGQNGVRGAVSGATAGERSSLLAAERNLETGASDEIQAAGRAEHGNSGVGAPIAVAKVPLAARDETATRCDGPWGAGPDEPARAAAAPANAGRRRAPGEHDAATVEVGAARLAQSVAADLANALASGIAGREIEITITVRIGGARDVAGAARMADRAIGGTRSAGVARGAGPALACGDNGLHRRGNDWAGASRADDTAAEARDGLEAGQSLSDAARAPAPARAGAP